MHGDLQGERLPWRQHDGTGRRRLNDQIWSLLAGRTIHFLFFLRLGLLFFLQVVERVEQVAQSTVVVRSFARRMVSRRHDQLHWSHARFNPKSRIYIGNQPATRNDQPIHSFTRSIRPATTRHTRPNRSRPHSRDTSLPVNQHHPSGLAGRTHRHPVDIHPCPYGATSRIRRVPSRRVKARRTLSIHQCRNALPEQVEHLQPYRRRSRQLIRYDRRGIEWIGVVRPQGESIWQGHCPQRRQRQREIPAPIG